MAVRGLKCRVEAVLKNHLDENIVRHRKTERAYRSGKQRPRSFNACKTEEFAELHEE